MKDTTPQSASADNIGTKYRIIKKLGSGAMGDVYLVAPPYGEAVALKLLRNLDTQTSEQAILQFENEFKVLNQLAHPNIAQIYDYGFDHSLKKVFFTLPWLKGVDIFLATELLTPLECERLFVQTLRALNYLHQKNLFHCDLKPGNIHVEDDKALLIDFGLTGYFGENIVGTPTYLAPEIFRGNPHNALSDLYALGIIFYYCLTRIQPFSGKSLQEVYDRHRTHTPANINELNPRVPKYLSDIIMTMIHKRPQERFPSARDVISEINAYTESPYPIETHETLLAYLPTAEDVPIEQATDKQVEQALNDFIAPENMVPFHLLLICGKKNIGKTRLVARIKHQLQLGKISIENITPPLQSINEANLLQSHAMILEYLDTFKSTKKLQSMLQPSLTLIEQKIISSRTNKFLLIATSTDEADFGKLIQQFPKESTQSTLLHLQPYTLAETKSFLGRILGTEQLPEAFVQSFYTNSEGLPGIMLLLIQSLIEEGNLFDTQGRWSEELLTHLDKAFQKISVAETLEQDFEKIYDTFSAQEEEVVRWLSLCTHPLTTNQIFLLMKQNPALDSVLTSLVQKNVLTKNIDGYILTRSLFKNFITQNMPSHEMAKRHSSLANLSLSKRQALQHLFLGFDEKLALRAAQKLAESLEHEGQVREALETCLTILNRHVKLPLAQRAQWILKASSHLVTLDRFDESLKLLLELEETLRVLKPKLNPQAFVVLLEKSGLCYLHLGQLENAKKYFTGGISFCCSRSEFKLHEIRFQNHMAEMEFFTGNPEKAIQIFVRTREQAHQLTLVEQAQITNNDLGHVYLTLGEIEKGMACLREDLRTFCNRRHREPLARALYSYAEGLRSLQETTRAQETYETCIEICKADNFYPLLLRAYNGLGNLFLSGEDLDKAVKFYQKALDIAVRYSDEATKAGLLYNQGYIYRRQKNTTLAERRFLMARQVLENKTDPLLAHEARLLSLCYNELSQTAKSEQSPARALGYQLERLKLVNQSASLKAERFMVRWTLAEMYLLLRHMDAFRREMRVLETQATMPDELIKIKELKDKLFEIESHLTQDKTGVLQATMELDSAP